MATGRSNGRGRDSAYGLPGAALLHENRSDETAAIRLLFLLLLLRALARTLIRGPLQMKPRRRNLLTSAAAFAGAGLLPRAMAAATPSFPRLLSGNYTLAFADEFDDTDVTRLNENAVGGRPGVPAWRSRYRHPRKDVTNKEKQIYMDPQFAGTSDRPLQVQPFSIADSVLTIRADRADPVRVSPHIWNYAYTSGCITTELTHWQKYGYFEARVRLPLGKGFWPAFWLLPKREAWPPEIDVFEASGARPDCINVGIIEYLPPPQYGWGGWVPLPKASADGFRVLAMEWTEKRIRFIADGVVTYDIGKHALHEEMYLLLNLALGSHDPTWIPDPDASTPFPGKFEIDYVRAYRREG